METLLNRVSIFQNNNSLVFAIDQVLTLKCGYDVPRQDNVLHVSDFGINDMMHSLSSKFPSFCFTLHNYK